MVRAGREDRSARPRRARRAGTDDLSRASSIRRGHRRAARLEPVVKPWWITHPRRYWTAGDWREARRLGVVPPQHSTIDPAERLLGERTPKVLALTPSQLEAGAGRAAATEGRRGAREGGPQAAPLGVTDWGCARDAASCAELEGVRGSPPVGVLECQPGVDSGHHQTADSVRACRDGRRARHGNDHRCHLGGYERRCRCDCRRATSSASRNRHPLDRPCRRDSASAAHGVGREGYGSLSGERRNCCPGREKGAKASPLPLVPPPRLHLLPTAPSR